MPGAGRLALALGAFLLLMCGAFARRGARRCWLAKQCLRGGWLGAAVLVCIGGEVAFLTSPLILKPCASINVAKSAGRSCAPLVQVEGCEHLATRNQVHVSGYLVAAASLILAKSADGSVAFRSGHAVLAPESAGLGSFLPVGVKPFAGFGFAGAFGSLGCFGGWLGDTSDGLLNDAFSALYVKFGLNFSIQRARLGSRGPPIRNSRASR